MAEVLRCIFGPRLYRIFSENGRKHSLYESGYPEAFGDKIIDIASYFYSVTMAASPFIGYFMVKRGFFTPSGMYTLAHFGASFFILLASSYIIRGCGRLTSKEYRRFLKVLTETQKSDHQYSARKQLSMYDFDFKAWPIDFHWNESSDKKKSIRDFQYTRSSPRQPGRGAVASLISFPRKVARYIVAHWFGRRLLYPGSVKLLQTLMADNLADGRCHLLSKQGWRAKLQAEDNNEIDTMFVDKRSSGNEIGQILVIGCEGNAAFYEVGTIMTPLRAGYSVLGWNHPGFGGSTGLPFPEAERNAIDVVLKYAMGRLGFPIENIVLYAWSIGGYSASWAAMMYPDIRGLILDATFDTLTPLAVDRMPQGMSGLTEEIVNEYFPLFVYEHLSRYPGPVHLYRRTKDEMISTTVGDITTNRGNYLLVELLRSRYPNLITAASLESLTTYLSADNEDTKKAIFESIGVAENECRKLHEEYKEEEGGHFPCHIGDDLDNRDKTRVLIYLATRYLTDLHTTHCTALSSSKFRIPTAV